MRVAGMGRIPRGWDEKDCGHSIRSTKTLWTTISFSQQQAGNRIPSARAGPTGKDEALRPWLDHLFAEN